MKCRGIIQAVTGKKINVQMQKMGIRRVKETYVVNLDGNTQFINCNINDLCSNATVQVTFNGIVALSMPPQIYAEKIRLI